MRATYARVYRPGHPLAGVDGSVSVHRLVAWEAGLLDDASLEVHHIDGDPRNNDPSNLFACTHEQHAQFHDQTAAIQRAKTHCPEGHPYDDENTYVTPSGSRQCRICRRRLHREAVARRAEREGGSPRRECVECGRVLTVAGLGRCGKCYQRIRKARR